MMEDTRRNQILACIEREFIGPDPIEEAGCLQENGEEILSGDPPHMRYIAGILFPKETQDENAEFSSEDQIEVNQDDNTEPSAADNEASKDDWFTDSDQAEDLINRSNAYKQSALSLTCAVQPGSEIVPFVHAATYERVKQMDSIRQKESVKYLRRPLEWNNDGNSIVMPNRQNPIVTIPVGNSKLQFDITWRYHRGGCDICTFTLENTNVCGDKTVSDGSCFFQVGFKLISGMPFPPLPESVRINTGDEDYQSNRLLYRNVHNYAIGHGCAHA